MKAYIQIFYNLFLIISYFGIFSRTTLEKEGLFVLDFPSSTSRKRGSIRFGFSRKHLLPEGGELNTEFAMQIK